MRPDELDQTIQAVLPTGLRLLVSGKPGIGKTEIIKSATSKMGWETIVSHPAVDDPTDYKGLPWMDQKENIARFFPIGQIAEVLRATKPTNWFIDDIGQAPLSVQAALMQWVHSRGRELNGMRLPDCVQITMATNRREDKSGVTGFLEAFKDRACIVELNTHYSDWTNWAVDNDIDPRVIAYINWRPNSLSDFKPSPGLDVSPSPRGWQMASDILGTPGIPGSVLLEMLKGAVGPGPSAEFSGFLRTYAHLPSRDQIMSNPKTAPFPREKSEQFATTLVLANLVNDPQTKLNKLVEYVERFDEEFQMLWTTLAPKYNKNLTDTQEFTNWCIAKQDLMIG